MPSTFLDAFMATSGTLLPLLLVGALLVGGAVLAFRRRRHIAALRAKVRGEVALPPTMLDTLKGVFTPEVTEAGAVGAVTLVDLAWQYSVAEPAVWDHLGSAAAERLTDLSGSIDALQGSMGSITESLHLAEATHVMADMLSAMPTAGEAAITVVDAPTTGIVDTLADSTTDGGGLLLHVPLVTIGFATYRAWRRSQKGTVIKRNVEFAAIEVTTRAGGGLAGAKLGGTVGTVVAPGVGSVIGTVAGAIAGTLGGALLGETVKKRHIDRAERDLKTALDALGRTYLHDDANFKRIIQLFREHEAQAIANIADVRRRLRRYRTPWRVIWPDERLILLEETVQLSQERLNELRGGTAEAIDKLNYMRAADQTRELGTLLAANPALQGELACAPSLVERVRETSTHLSYELGQLHGAAS
jgi:uncharacterized protein YcfJ